MRPTPRSTAVRREYVHRDFDVSSSHNWIASDIIWRTLRCFYCLVETVSYQNNFSFSETPARMQALSSKLRDSCLNQPNFSLQSFDPCHMVIKRFFFKSTPAQNECFARRTFGSQRLSVVILFFENPLTHLSNKESWAEVVRWNYVTLAPPQIEKATFRWECA